MAKIVKLNVNNQNPIQICIVSDQLAVGGAEKVSALLSIFFEKKGIKVQHVIVVDKVEYDFLGQLLNLGKLKNKSNGVFNKLKRFWVLYRFLRNNNFNYIIDTRVRNNLIQEYIVSKYVYNAPLIIIVHSYMTNMYFPKNNFFTQKIISHCYKIIGVSDAIYKKLKSEFTGINFEKINNPVEIALSVNETTQKQFDFKFILAVGRMNEPVKQFDKLILCYAKSILPENGIKLVLLGDGILKYELELLCSKLGVEKNVLFYGQVANVNLFYKNAMFTVLSSKNEGFPNVLIESLACDTPVVSFDCESGPNEIIQHRLNGLLIENQNEEKLTEAMNEFFLDKEFYKYCKQNAKSSVEVFSIENIGQEWLKMMKLE